MIPDLEHIWLGHSVTKFFDELSIVAGDHHGPFGVFLCLENLVAFFLKFLVSGRQRLIHEEDIRLKVPID